MGLLIHPIELSGPHCRQHTLDLVGDPTRLGLWGHFGGAGRKGSLPRLDGVRAPVRVARAEGVDLWLPPGACERATDQAGVEAADDRGAAADFREQAVGTGDRAATVDLVLAAHLAQRFECAEDRAGAGATQTEAERSPSLADGLVSTVAQPLERLGQGLGQHVVPAHRVADLNRAGGEAIDLGRLADQTPAALDLQVAESHQSLQVLERHRTMDAGHLGDVIYRAWLPVGVEAKQDVAPGEVAKRAKGTLHVGCHIHQHIEIRPFEGYIGSGTWIPTSGVKSLTCWVPFATVGRPIEAGRV